jgi:hypothetical protein
VSTAPLSIFELELNRDACCPTVGANVQSTRREAAAARARDDESMQLPGKAEELQRITGLLGTNECANRRPNGRGSDPVGMQSTLPRAQRMPVLSELETLPGRKLKNVLPHISPWTNVLSPEADMSDEVQRLHDTACPVLVHPAAPVQ